MKAQELSALVRACNNVPVTPAGLLRGALWRNAGDSTIFTEAHLQTHSWLRTQYGHSLPDLQLASMDIQIIQRNRGLGSHSGWGRVLGGFKLVSQLAWTQHGSGEELYSTFDSRTSRSQGNVCFDSMSAWVFACQKLVPDRSSRGFVRNLSNVWRPPCASSRLRSPR